MEIIKSNRGKPKLCDTSNGFMYVVKRRTEHYTEWRCEKFGAPDKCTAIIKTDGIDPISEKAPIHNHVGDIEKVKVTKIYQTMKERASTSQAVPIKIFAEGVLSLASSTRSRMPEEGSARRTLRNRQRSNKPRMPTKIDDLVIEDEWTQTGGEESTRFLLVDNENNESRIIIFATDRMLELLGNTPDWFLDGNFKLAPQLFQQLYVIRVLYGRIMVTAVYVFLQRKSYETYEELFTLLMAECRVRNIFPDPVNFYMDFELAVMKAVREIFGAESQIRGCFYHLCQSTYRQIQALGLVEDYKNDVEFNRFCGKLDGLAFLPIEDVLQGMEHLKAISFPIALPLVQYFDENYVSGTYRRVGKANESGVKMKRNPPRFPPETWNVHDRTLEDAPRTNNSTEGWNNRFRHIVNRSHPSVFDLILKMRLESAADYTRLDQQDLGVVSSKKKRTAVEDKHLRLTRLCEQYLRRECDIPQFLKFSE